MQCPFEANDDQTDCNDDGVGDACSTDPNGTGCNDTPIDYGPDTDGINNLEQSPSNINIANTNVPSLSTSEHGAITI